MQKLTKSFIEQLKKPGYYRDSELPGLYLRAYQTRSGINKFYIVQAKPKGNHKNVTVSIGRHGIISTEQARIEARKILALLAQGINPNAEAKKTRSRLQMEEKAASVANRVQGTTLEQLLKEYLSAHSLKEKTQRDYDRFLRRCVPEWLKMPVARITRDMVQNKYLQLSDTHPAQANYTMRILRALFTYAIAIFEDSHGRPLLSVNPVDRLKHARLWHRVTRRQTVIKPHQLKEWYKGVQKLARTDARDLLLVELFTGLRHSEAAGLLWKNVDFDSKTIHLIDTKNRSDHMLPMSSYLYDILINRFQSKESDAYVFPGNGKFGHLTDIRDSIKKVEQLSGIKFCEHDLRRTFETTAESLDISYYSLKRLLNHKIGHDPTAGYIVSSAERLRDASQQVADTLALHMKFSNKKPHSSFRKHKVVQR